MSDTIIGSVLDERLDITLLLKWLSNESIEEAPDDCILHCCSRSEFVAYFLSYLRNQTDSILQTNSNAVQILQNSTPEKLRNTNRKHHRSISEPTSEEHTTDSLSVPNNPRSHESPNRDRKRTGRRVKTKLFTEDRNTSNVSASSDESRISMGLDRLTISSTPMKNSPKFSDYSIHSTSPITPRNVKDFERCDTPRVSHRHSRSHEKTCLGDYLVSATKSKKKGKKNTSVENEMEKVELDLSNSEMFPEIGARKFSSLRSERRRIKPTNIDKSQKSLSLNSFNSDSFQQPSPLALEDNNAFKHQKFKESSHTFEERNILKQERHKLMEKFNILNTSTPAKMAVMPQIKITQKESIEITPNYIKVDATKIVLKPKIDILIEIYDMLLKNNLILSMNTEIYFLISILLSKQCEEDYLQAESQLKDNNVDFLLKSIHNSTYFAVKSLWHQRTTLEVILDKNSLKTLGENKKVRNFSPDLAKFLLNCYCVSCETATHPPLTLTCPVPKTAVVNYNCETDSADNFPSLQASHLFKKQRDAFYDIVRWYQETITSGGSRTTFRSRVKAVVCSGAPPDNHAHLAALFLAHMAASCLPTSQESKLSKLQRRLTCPAAAGSHRLPHFNSSEMFYKDFITHAESETFRVHLRDALATDIIALDGAHLAGEDTANSNVDITRDYVELARKLTLLAKFLGYVTSLPYSQVATDCKNDNMNRNDTKYIALGEKVVENSLAVRNYSQPTIDLKGILHNAIENGRLSITIPWIAHYLSMLDYVTLRLKYYNDILKTLFDIYVNKLKIDSESVMKKNTIIYLKSVLGWLFDLPHFPSDVDAGRLKNSDGVDSIDSCDLVDQSTIMILCPSLKDVNVLLSSCRLSQEQKEMGSFRHITPVSLSVNAEDRMRNKEKEIQKRLEEELLKSQPSSWRRVIDVVIERAVSASVRASVKELPVLRDNARKLARIALGTTSQVNRVETVSQIYSAQLAEGRSAALAAGRAAAARAAGAALAALLPAAPAQLAALAARRAAAALAGWLRAHWSTTAVLCKDMEAEIRTLMSMNEMNITYETRDSGAAAVDFETNHVSVANTLIMLKEHICLLLDGSNPPDVTSLLHSCAGSCAAGNIYSRAPAQRAILHLSVDLCIVYVSKKPEEITESLLNKLNEVWNLCCPDRKPHTPEELTLPERRSEISPQLRNFEDDERISTPISDDEEIKQNGLDKQENQPICQTIQPINQANQPIIPSKQPISPTIQPINTMISFMTIIQPTKQNQGSKSQPMSPNVYSKQSFTISQPRSQPMSPTIQPRRVSLTTLQRQPLSPNTRQPIITATHQPIVCQPIGPMQPITPTTKNNVSSDSIDQTTHNVDSTENMLEYFDRILCPRNIVLLNATDCDKSVVWQAMATVLVYLLTNNYLSEDSLTEQCLAVYRQDWPQSILENLSTCMKSVSSRWSRSSTGKFTLFLDFLAEYCGDMDYEPLE